MIPAWMFSVPVRAGLFGSKPAASTAGAISTS